MPYQLKIVQGRGASPAVKLGAGVTTVGRQEDCQLRIRSSMVSRKHCQLFEKKGLLIVKDLGSSNGTLVNGKKIEDQRVLEPGDELTIGQVKLKVEKVEAAAKSGPKPGDTAVPEAVTVGADEVFDLDLEVEDEAETKMAIPVPSPAAAAKAPPPPPKPAPAKAEEPAADEPIEIGEDDVADFLLDLNIDDDDKS